jgi:hypothetical protein
MRGRCLPASGQNSMDAVRRRLRHRMLTPSDRSRCGFWAPVVGITDREVALTLALALNDQQGCLHYRTRETGRQLD